MLFRSGQSVVTDKGYIAVEDLGTFTSSLAEGKVVVGGSSSVSPVMEKMSEIYMSLNPNATIEIQTTDSTTGVQSTIEGTYDIGMASRELKDSELEQGVEGLVIAQDAIAVIVNNENAINGLSSEQVKGIYVGEYGVWSEIQE